jgi:hypothetical protein
MGLSNNQQAIAMFISAILLALGAISVPAGFPVWVAAVLFILGAIGMAMKEVLGGTTSPTITPTPVGSTFVQAKIDPAFSVTQAIATGYKVYQSSTAGSGGYVLAVGNNWETIYGTPLGNTQPAGTGPQVTS